MENIVLAPIILQFATSIVLMFLWKEVNIQRYISIISSFIGFVFSCFLLYKVLTSGFLVLHSGAWKAPFGITFVADTLSVLMVLLTSISSLAVSLYATTAISNSHLRFGFLPVFHFLITGLNGSFLTGDIFNLYVWFEIIVISSFILLSLGGERQQLEGITKYFTLNMLSSTFFLTGLGVLYGAVGTLNMADIHIKLSQAPERVVEIVGLLLLIGFGTKAAMFPFFYWLPSSYHTPPTAVSAIFGGLLTKVGVYALIRVFTLIIPFNDFINTLMLGLSVLTLIMGGLGAIVQNNLLRIFSYLIICHIGYMTLGLSLADFMGINASISYIIHDIIVKTNLFLISGVIYKISGTSQIKDLGDLYKTHPRLSLLFFLSLMALVGIPPTSGFWPKIYLIKGSLQVGDWKSMVYILTIIFASFITLMVMARIWSEVFWKNKIQLAPLKDFTYFDGLKTRRKVRLIAPIIFLSLFTLYISFGAEHIQQLSQRITFEIMSNAKYIQSVLN